jgi:hypothetical protein
LQRLYDYVFTSVTPQFICMTADHAVTKIFNQQEREYDTGRKLYPYPGIGCVTTWGTRDHNAVQEYLDGLHLERGRDTISELVVAVDTFLRRVYRPHHHRYDDVGYHVAGFDRERTPQLYHVFWGFNRPKNPRQIRRKYKTARYRYEDLVVPLFLYNGRNDIADNVVRSLLNEMRTENVANQDFSYSVTVARFGDFVARFAAELTQEVGPPFETAIISVDNEIEVVSNNSFAPLDDKILELTLRILGIPRHIPRGNRQVNLEIPVLPRQEPYYVAPSGIIDDSLRGGTVSPRRYSDRPARRPRAGTVSPDDVDG